ncbi:low temperature requirement protein A [Streptomyces sp. NBC_00096]|uniref:low temperature requirement protein A n=1 Tax=Streptomyces sp. NBC_00096 TaxID=2975650 RepID=UPI0032437D8C
MSGTEAVERRVTWAELFFDLVFVFAALQASELLHDDHGWPGVARAVIVFVPLYWAWVHVAIHANTHDVDTTAGRLGILATALCGLLVAMAIPQAYGERGMFFAVVYLVMRLVIVVTASRGDRRVLPTSITAAVVAGPLMVVGAFTEGTARELIWAAAMLIALAAPAVDRKRLALIRFDHAHLAERFGLFVTIAFGESLIDVGLAAAKAPHLDAALVTAVVVAFVLACGLWWLYYTFAIGAYERAVHTARVQTDAVRRNLAYAHLPLVGSVFAVAVGLADVVAHPTHHLPLGAAALLLGGVALYLATLAFTLWPTARGTSAGCLAAAAVVMALLPAATRIPALAALAALAAVVAGLNAREGRRRRADRD